MKILSYGEIIWDIYDDEKCIGGAPLNFAAHAALQGADTYLLSAVGDDGMAGPALDALNDFGVKCDLIGTANGKKTGQCLVTLDSNKVPSYHLLLDVAYDFITADTDKISGFDALCFGTLIQRSEHNVKTLEKLLKDCSFEHIFCDLNIRAPHFTRDSIMRCIENATILKISREELPTVMLEIFEKEISFPDDAAKMLSNAFSNLKLIIITLDKDGAIVFDTKTGKQYSRPAKNTEVVSTVGAGDSFSAAFLVSYLSDGNCQAALDAAIELSSFVVSRKEAVPTK